MVKHKYNTQKNLLTNFQDVYNLQLRSYFHKKSVLHVQTILEIWPNIGIPMWQLSTSKIMTLIGNAKHSWHMACNMQSIYFTYFWTGIK